MLEIERQGSDYVRRVRVGNVIIVRGNKTGSDYIKRLKGKETITIRDVRRVLIGWLVGYDK